MTLYLDSSSLVKRYIYEAGTEKVNELCRAADAILLSLLSIPEVISSFNRLLREGKITKREYQLLKENFLDDIDEADIFDINPEIIRFSIDLLENGTIRTLDALHVATALFHGIDLFVSSDKRQLAAAQKTGIHTQLV
jgi:uncharacterized protein